MEKIKLIIFSLLLLAAGSVQAQEATSTATSTAGQLNISGVLPTLVYFVSMFFTMLWPVALVIGIAVGFIAAMSRVFNFKVTK